MYIFNIDAKVDSTEKIMSTIEESEKYKDEDEKY
jgi:hypothetical protein